MATGLIYIVITITYYLPDIFYFFILDVNYYTDEKGHFWPEEHMPLLADRYRYMAVVGTGQSSVLLEAQVIRLMRTLRGIIN